MSDLRRENHGSDDKFLDELIDAARTETAHPDRADAAQRRLMERLAHPGPLTHTADWRDRLAALLFGSRRRTLGFSLATAAFLLVAIPALLTLSGGNAAQASPVSTPGELLILSPTGEVAGVCPLRHTDVSADLSGFVGRVTVTQTFHNSTHEKIEAVYVFPLPANAAVDQLELLVGAKRIVGAIKPRSEARRIYDDARARGHVAGLLDQERPNIFTQSVANIEPGATVRVQISYVQTMKYENGGFEFVFPMVVAPRYIPGAVDQGPQTTGTAQVPDAANITPPVAMPATSAPPALRDGNDIGMTIHLDAGLQIQHLESKLHEVAIERPTHTRALVRLKNQREIPNRDFILRCETATDHIGDAMLTHSDPRGTFFTFIFEPPKWTQPDQIVPKEMIFVIDKSGSMSGWKIEKAKAAMKACLEGLTPDDTFNLLSFSGGLGKLFDESQPATPENIQRGLAYLDATESGGGTEMMPAIQAALEKSSLPIALAGFQTNGGSILPLLERRTLSGTYVGQLPDHRDQPYLTIPNVPHGKVSLPLYDPRGFLAPLRKGDSIRIRLGASTQQGFVVEEILPDRLRIVGFMTDGEVGNDFAILDHVRNNAGTTRVFAFGVGDSTNRFLLQGMADLGRGTVEFVDSTADPAEAARNFFVRVNAPLLTDISIDWGGLPIDETYPSPLPDLFSAQPIMIQARVNAAGGPLPANASITLRGRTAAGPFERTIPFRPSMAGDHNSSLPSLWARAKVEHLMREDMQALQSGNFPAALKDRIIALGMEFNLMTQFTSFVAVEADRVTRPAPTKQVRVAVDKPRGEHGPDGIAPVINDFRSPIISDDTPATNSNDFVFPDSINLQESDAANGSLRPESLKWRFFEGGNRTYRLDNTRASGQAVNPGNEEYYLYGPPFAGTNQPSATGSIQPSAGSVIIADYYDGNLNEFGTDKSGEKRNPDSNIDNYINYDSPLQQPASGKIRGIYKQLQQQSQPTPALSNYGDSNDQPVRTDEPIAPAALPPIEQSQSRSGNSDSIDYLETLAGDNLVAPGYDPAEGTLSNRDASHTRSFEAEASRRAWKNEREIMERGEVSAAHSPLVDGAAIATTASLSLPAGQRRIRIITPVSIQASANSLAGVSTSTLVVAMYVVNSIRLGIQDEGSKAILLVWRDGTAIWSADPIRGGAPYSIGKIDPAAISGATEHFERENLMNRDDLARPMFGPDSSTTTIAVLDQNRRIVMESWHELAEQNPDVVVVSGAITGLNGRDRASVIAQDTSEYRAYRETWSSIKSRLLSLAPAQGEPVNAQFKTYWIDPQK